MNVYYAKQALPDAFEQSIFLAGPTPRSPQVPSWRPEALRLLAEANYQGVVFSPELESGERKGDYDDQVEWEQTALGMSDAILFWVPRRLETLPGFTTNTEFGQWLDSGRIAVFGAPENAANVRYQLLIAKKHSIPSTTTLEAAIRTMLKNLDEGGRRTGGERNIPLVVWHSPSFQAWYRAQLRNGNRLDGAKVYWRFLVGPSKLLFFWTIHAKIFVPSEQRWKSNEVVIGRPDIACVVLLHPQPDPLDTEVVLVREFRTPVRNSLGSVLEVPGGSMITSTMPMKAQACKELREETGFELPLHRLKRLGSRQLCATLTSHHAHVYTAAMTDAELAWLHQHVHEVHGIADDGERTTLELHTIRDLLQQEHIDWSMLGMVLAGLQQLSS